jgi:hypothetical protein
MKQRIPVLRRVSVPTSADVAAGTGGYVPGRLLHQGEPLSDIPVRPYFPECRELPS